MFERFKRTGDGGTAVADRPVTHENGTTTASNGAGLCEACNHTKEHQGWKATPRPGPRHTIELRTPTGHTYYSTAPPLPGTSIIEQLATERLARAS